MTLSYAAVALALAPVIGITRSCVRFSAGALPNQYLAQSALINAGLFLIFAAAGIPLVLGLGALLRRRTGSVARHWRTICLAATLGFAFFLFWGFNTSIGFRVLHEFFQGKTKTVLTELSYWLPGMLAFLGAATFLSRGPDGRRVIRRAALVLAVGVLAVVGLRIYSHRTDPSITNPPNITASASRKPHVFLVLVDTLRADHLGAYGYPKPTSPSVDAFAAESVVFDRAFAPAPWTRPSCGSLLTSRYPPETGLDGIFKPLPREIPILPQYLREEGYRTAGIVSSVHLSAQFGFAKGWDLLDIGTTYLQWTGTKLAFNRLGIVAWGEAYPRYDARELTDRAVDWLDDQLEEESAEPVFMYLHYSDPHAPYRPPKEHDRWREFAAPQVRESVTEPPFSPTWLNRQLTDQEVGAMVARYDAEIAYFDEQFERFLQHLRSIGLYDRSLIILTADHGEEFRDHGGWTHSHSLYNELIHVPLIIKYPRRLGVAGGRRVEVTSSLVDVIPTIGDVLGARWSEQRFRGRSLLREDLEEDDYTVYSKADSPLLRAVVRGQDKLIQTMRGSDVAEERYFSLLEDFAEQGPGSIPDGRIDPQRLAEMRTILVAIDSLQATQTSDEISLDDETLRELKALGYIN